MKKYFLIVVLSVCYLISGCKQETVKSKEIINNSKVADEQVVKSHVQKQKLDDDKSIVLRSEANGVKFLVRKDINGQFMIDQDYSEKLKVDYGNCSIDLPKTIGQAKIKILPQALKHGDWNNDNKIDWKFAYRINEDGLDYVINYILITDCKMYLIENIFYEDEDTFLEEYEEDVSHIDNIKNAHDFYRRNFDFQLEKQPKMSNALKSYLKESFSEFIKNNEYR